MEHENEQEVPQHEAQKFFDARYITGKEIMARLDLTRAALLGARRRKLLPEPIVVNDGQLFIWERATVRKYIDAWEIILKARRGE